MIRLKGTALWTLLYLLTATGMRAQADYYRSVEGLKREQLKTALFRLIQPGTVLGYGGKGEGYTWAGFAQVDRMDGDIVRDRYSREVRTFNGVSAVDGMNIEHVFANSWWGHAVNNAYCDLFNLFPSDGAANGRKSNNPMGVVTETPVYDNGVIRVGRSSSYRPDSLITVWEPADNWKGDFARTFFYMATCYQDYADLWQTTEGLLTVERTAYPTLRSWVTDLLLQWAEEDPVDEIERARNEGVYAIQGNRNPFVDYPQLADYVWGDSVDYAFYINKEYAEPELFVPADEALVDYGLQALSKGMHESLVVRGRNLPGGLTLTVDNTDFILGKTVLTEEEVRSGVAVSVVCRAEKAGVNEARLTLKGAGFEQHNTLRVEYVDGIPAYPATDVVCSVSTKRFTASWMDMGEGLTYAVEVYTKDETGGMKMVNGYPKETTDTSLRVEGLSASTTYYYKVSVPADGMQSNEVRVDMPGVTPVFTAGVSELSFVTIPGRPSPEQTVTVTALEVPQYVSQVMVEAPFEVSADGETWGTELQLRGTSQTFRIRLGAVPTEGAVEGELVISTQGVQDIIVTLTGEVDRQKAFFENFEAGTKGAYAAGQVVCSTGEWYMKDALIGTIAGDKKNGTKSVRMRTAASLEMLTDKVNGCDSLLFYAGLYGTDSGANTQLTVSQSQDGGISWTPVDNISFVKGEWKRYVYYLHTDGLIRLKFDWSPGGNSKRLNIDDIQMSDYDTNAGGTDVREVGVSPDDKVEVYTLDGIHVRTARRKDALKGLKPDYYIVR
ncbi:MAG: endonuclease [Paraprevotella sp.]|nr:endonuclease [Paraprevotella sp.]